MITITMGMPRREWHTFALWLDDRYGEDGWKFFGIEPTPTQVRKHKWTAKPKMIQSYAVIKNAIDMLHSVHHHGNPEAFITDLEFTITSTRRPVSEVIDGAINKHVQKFQAIYDKLFPDWLADKMKPKDYEAFLGARRVLIDAGIPVMRDDGVVR